MPHFYLENFANEWTLIRETSSSQKFKVMTPEKLQLAVDVHYTMPKVLTANISFAGKERDLGRDAMTLVMDEMAQIALKRDDYAVIDYTLVYADCMFDGNFSIASKDRTIRKL
jgi:hypothetical protein